MSKPDWSLYNTYKESHGGRMSAYFSKTHMPSFVCEELIEDSIIDAILTDEDPMEIFKKTLGKESKHQIDKVSLDVVDLKGFHIVDSVLTGCKPDIFEVITALPQEFRDKYCTKIELDTLEALAKFITPMAVAAHLGVSNILISQRICMLKKKFIKYKKGIHIKQYRDVGDRYKIDSNKITTRYRRVVADLYLKGISYGDMSKILCVPATSIASVIHNIRRK